MTLAYETILYTVQNGVAHITLNRPQQANALNAQMMKELFDAAIRCDTNPEVRAVLITSTGKIFCAGGDLKSFVETDNLPATVKELTTFLHGAVSRFVRMDAPVVVAINGTTAGGGLSLVFAGDIVYAGESASFTMGYTAVGLSPDGSSSYFLPRLVGLRRALELTLTNRHISAQEALSYGMLTQVFPDDECLGAATAVAENLASGATAAIGIAKRLMHNSLTESLETQMEYESQGIAAMGATNDAHEGIRAFIEKRLPEFRGE